MAIITIFAYLVKGVLGFGEGLITISLFLLFLDAKFVLPLALLLALIGGLYQLFHFRKNVDRATVGTMIIPLVSGVVVGTYLLNILDSEIIMLFFAVFLIVYSGKLLFFQKKDGSLQKKMKKVVAVPVGLISGIIDGLIGTGGVPIILYLNRQEISKLVFRATCVASFVILAISRTVTYSYAGLINAEVIRITVYLIPGVVVGSFLGIKLHNVINEVLFRKIVLLALLVIGILLLIK